MKKDRRICVNLTEEAKSILVELGFISGRGNKALKKGKLSFLFSELVVDAFTNKNLDKEYLLQQMRILDRKGTKLEAQKRFVAMQINQFQAEEPTELTRIRDLLTI